MFEFVKEFFSNRKQKKSERLSKVITNRKAIKEDRMVAIEYFASMDDADIAIPALLARFEYSLDQGIQDSKEKNIALEGITQHGEKAVAYLTDHIKKTQKIAWPIKALNTVADNASCVESLLSAMHFTDVSLDQAKTDKNYDILCYLADYQIDVEKQNSLLVFLEVMDERVRFAAAELLADQETLNPKARDRLERFLKDDSTENRRLRIVAIEAFIRHGWVVSKMDNFDTNTPIIDHVFVTKQGKLERR